MNDDWDLIFSLKQENGELKARQKRLYHFLWDVADDIQFYGDLNSPPYLKIMEFLKAEGFIESDGIIDYIKK